MSEVPAEGKRTDPGISDTAIEELDSYDAHFQPIQNAVQRARDSQNTSHFGGSNGAPTPIAGAVPPSSEVERAMNYDATKDPRVREPRVS